MAWYGGESRDGAPRGVFPRMNSGTLRQRTCACQKEGHSGTITAKETTKHAVILRTFVVRERASKLILSVSIYVFVYVCTICICVCSIDFRFALRSF